MADANPDEAKILQQLLGDSFAQSMVDEMRIASDPPEVQAEMLSLLGENIFQRVVLEILKKLPPDAVQAFRAQIGAGDLEALRATVAPHIPDLDAFVASEAQKELTLLRERMRGAVAATY